jgi:hypothetical protein
MSAAFTPCAKNEATMLDFLSLIGTPVAAPLPPGMTQQQADACFKRTSSTLGNRQYKKAKHEELLETVGGDREALKTICVWVPRKSTQRLFARAFDKKACAEGGERFQDVEYEFEATEYDLEEVEVERARHPDEEVAFAKLQRRFIERKPSIDGFFHKPTMKCGDYRRASAPTALGDFEWCERDENVTREQQIAHSLAKLRANRPIRNVREAC